jgi:hypothetical protein
VVVDEAADDVAPTHRVDVRIISEDGALLEHLMLDPSRDYQPQGS